MFETNTVNIQVWEDGVLVCNGGDGINWSSDESTFHVDCKNGNKATVTDNARKFEWIKADGSKPVMDIKDYNFESTICAYLEFKDIKGSDMESVWGSGDCQRCPQPLMCGLYTCKKYKPECVG
jgi:hypothetical protein